MVAKLNRKLAREYAPGIATNGGKRQMAGVKAIAAQAVAAVKEHLGTKHSQTGASVPEHAVIHLPNDIDVVEVRPGTDYRTQPKHTADFMCIDAHAFGVTEALEWTKNANSYARSQKRRPPLIALLADDDRLSQKDYGLATREFSRAGGFFYEYPAGCRTFIEALKAFASGLAKNYRAPIAGKK
jgi:hypothetical protein